MPIYKMKGSKDGKQKYRVRFNYTDRNGKKCHVERVTYGSTEAKMLEAQLQKEYSGGQAEMSSRITVKELYEQYMESKRHEWRESTYEKTQRRMNDHVLPSLGNIRLDRLNAQVLQTWKNEIAGSGLAVSTQKGVYAELRALLNYGVRMEYIARSPLAIVGNFKGKDFTSQKDKIQYYTSEEFKRYIAVARRAAEDKDNLFEWGFYVFFMVAYYTGMRKGEINALKWSDIESDIINVRRSVSQKIKGMTITETPPKNESSCRSLQMPLPLIEALNEHKVRYQAIGEYSDDLRVCGGKQCLSDTSIENRNTRFAKEAGLHHLRIHEFRHSHASVLCNEAINILEIARRLGHSDIKQTLNTYAHLYPREEERAVQILNRVKWQKPCIANEKPLEISGFSCFGKSCQYEPCHTQE